MCVYVFYRMQKEFPGKKFITLKVYISKKKKKKKFKTWEPKHPTQEVRIENVIGICGWKSCRFSQHFIQWQGRLSPQMVILIS